MTMHVGVARVELRLPGNRSLKGKRTVVKSVLERVSHRFNVAVAEVDTQDVWHLATLGIACVSNDPRHANAMLSSVVEYIERERLDAEVGVAQIDVVPIS